MELNTVLIKTIPFLIKHYVLIKYNTIFIKQT